MSTEQTKEASVDPIRQKALGLFEFLKEIVQIRSITTRDNKDYPDVLWLHEIPQETGCYCAGWPENKNPEDNVWVEIKKQNLPKLPDLPKDCALWVDKTTLYNFDSTPTLLESILNPEWKEKNLLLEQTIEDSTDPPKEILQYFHLKDFPEIQSAWGIYVEKSWRPWTIDYKKKKVVQDIYARLFSMCQQQKALGESYEVVLGLGLLNWKTPKETNIFRHITSAQVDIDFDSNQGTIAVKPSVEGARWQFEQDMLDPDERPQMLQLYLQLQDRLKEMNDDIWHGESMPAILRSWIQALHANGAYSDSWNFNREFGNDPKLNFAPALILRKRTTRGFVRFIDDILGQIKSKIGEIPATIKMYVDIQEDGKVGHKSLDGGFDKTDDSPTSTIEEEVSDGEIYFPLPANQEQREIIKKLGKRLGVLVQGPPGTGKSHTIANLICHLLASGKRVLVTSQSSRALKVLMGKLPEKIRPLCVNLLGRGLSDVQSMERSVSEINLRYNTWNAGRARESIKKYEGMLFEARKRLQETEALLRELREAETRKFSVVDGIYRGTAQQIAAKLSAEEDSFGWLQDEISVDSVQPISKQEFKKFLGLRREISQEKVAETKRKRLALSELPLADKFVEMVHSRQKSREKADQVSGRLDILHLVNSLKQLPKEVREKAIGVLNQFRRAKQEALKRPLPWIQEAVNQILGAQEQPLKELALSTKSLLEGLKEKAREADEIDARWPEAADLIKLKADAEDLCTHLKSGGKLGWGAFRSKIVKRTFYITQQILVNGRACETSELLEKLISCIGVELRLRKLEKIWSDKINPPKGTWFHRSAIYFEQDEALSVALGLEDNERSVAEALTALDGLIPPKLHDFNEVEQLFMALDSVRAIDELSTVQANFDVLYKRLAAITTVADHHVLMDKFMEALEKSDWKMWGEACEGIKKIEATEKSIEEWLRLEQVLRDALPATEEELEGTYKEGYWDERIENFDNAWNWAKGEAWLVDYSNRHDEYELQKNYAYQQNHIVKIMEELAAEKAWAYCFDRLTENQRQHLMAWAVSIKKIGKGTGKYAEKHRRDAEGHLRECQDAIPAWIMPLYRVVDTVKPVPGIFDVVIIDEASQCGAEALLLQYIAKQCIIVGDEEQIAPDGVGIEKKQVHYLIEQFLGDVPIKESFDLESSLFTHAKIRYKDKVVLREHFRCVPEIIQFSNNLCYAPSGASLIPLRQYPPNRLEPIKTVYVPEGFREGNSQHVMNKAEAEKVVEKIIACHNDKRYHGKSFGVISLQGHAQSKHIEKRLIEALGPEAIEKRSIICGDPYDFQGDERDVMFISMVAATNERPGVLTKDTDKRRFNVAASRAADQAWLFHSIPLEELNDKCFRYQLLSYYLNPQVQPLELDGVDFGYLKTAKRSSLPPEPFDSWFEVDVYILLVERGYRVIPQFRVANYRIDLVIEGMKGRLAVECDGDEWHGPEQYESDMARQRILERANWSFWRVRGSGYYRDPSQALEPLWQRLEELGIHPKGYQYAKTDKTEEKSQKEEKNTQEEAFYSREEGSVDETSTKSPELFEIQNNLVLEIAIASELESFSQKEDNEKKLSPAISRAIVLKLLELEPSKGVDLLPNAAIRLLGYTCRRADRRRLERKIQRAISDLIRVGKIEEYSTNKRKRVKIIKASQ